MTNLPWEGSEQICGERCQEAVKGNGIKRLPFEGKAAGDDPLRLDRKAGTGGNRPFREENREGRQNVIRTQEPAGGAGAGRASPENSVAFPSEEQWPQRFGHS